MLELIARPRSERIPLETECITPDSLGPLSLAEIEQQPALFGNRTERLGDFFDVRGDAAGGEIHLSGDTATVKWVGHCMSRGRIVVEGDIGMHLGSSMTGGQILVRGSAGDWVGAEMSGGHIQVIGDAGHLIGSAYRGGKVGMTGGVILVHGSAGNEVAGSMRRGLVAIGRGCGDFAGVSMIAGSVFVFGEPGIRLGAGMRRGTIALFGVSQGDVPILPTFRYDCDYSPTFLALYLAQLRRWGFPVPRDYLGEGLFRRYRGDLIELGRGEILSWRPGGR